MYAVPSPSFPPRCIVWTRGLALAVSSAMTPVPSGELSSTTRISSRGSWARTCVTRVARFAASLYVGTTISARSARSPISFATDHCRGEREREQHAERKERDEPPRLVGVGSERQLDALCACGHRHREERVVAPEYRSRRAVDGRDYAL